MAAPRRFRNWSQADLESAIRALEEGLASGVARIGYPSGGSIEYVSRGQANAVLDDLYQAVDSVTNAVDTAIRRVRIKTFGNGI